LSKLFGGNSSLEFSMSRIFKRTDDNESMLRYNTFVVFVDAKKLRDILKIFGQREITID
jgi:hypothetical protein